MLHGHTRGGGLNIQVKAQYVDLYTYILFPTSNILLLWVGRFGRPPTQSVSRLFDELGMSLNKAIIMLLNVMLLYVIH